MSTIVSWLSIYILRDSKNLSSRKFNGSNLENILTVKVRLIIIYKQFYIKFKERLHRGHWK